ncbi:hypothetical protein A2533_02695 [Candidatus Falkowbacteria bacterium RIFOXYD2_FULL_35_9]|uniref:ribose-phosphate diphosphokinase n=1 Tax=Candidatus Falkowbacteria bacterium RIFOXYC2_FULL_36_12 TaxID=1798002 RepID=A0A1F5T3H1_9BACT|nr:MAG: hypothetical protein A2300_02650 [Candidatus Falkowbacteria bacterium RIFOXYB2_FULL_35_7]OGF33300.1 MAG: hypothetical protein A2223_04455 [Candidatus Falkowbacteria bacterium RIFOXYA2_FULL_35_8]OGF33505.1 MAG: hypothetical protein A2478_02355 [Candidatus Falkowbacteria bacterium RIFOXYC2_FULL_36_12]OGF47773.1 MAG: hypothetical protein A2533_02695 [Candidatus Falkowbacteria bacterium RIFOXYD2_FULL_35_9]
MFGKRPFKFFHDGSHPDLVRMICERLGQEEGRLNWELHSQGEFRVQIDDNIRLCDNFVFGTHADPVQTFNNRLKTLLRTIRRHSDGWRKLLNPYMKNIRSDREDEARVSIGVRDEADELFAAGAQSIVIAEPHFEQVVGVFNPEMQVDFIFGTPYFVNYIKQQGPLNNVTVVSADFGGAKRAGRVASKIGAPIAFIDKRRDDHMEKVVPVAVIGDVKGRDCVIPDDEACSLGTLIEDTKYLLLHGARSVKAVITHPILTHPERMRELQAIDEFSELVVCNTVPVSEEKRSCLPKMKIIDTSNAWAEAVKCIRDGNGFRGGQSGLLARMYDEKQFPIELI